MIEKPLTPSGVPAEDGAQPDVEIAVADPEAVVVEMEDGSLEITFGDEDESEDVIGEHDDNLAELLEDDELEAIATELLDAVDIDKRSRREWAEAYIHGLELLGMKIEERTEPWAGASGVFHPMLSEAVVRFQAQAMVS